MPPERAGAWADRQAGSLQRAESEERLRDARKRNERRRNRDSVAAQADRAIAQRAERETGKPEGPGPIFVQSKPGPLALHATTAVAQDAASPDSRGP